MLYFRGDIHGEVIGNFGLKRHPWMRDLTEDDYLIILGDCGVPWNKYTIKQDIYKLNWLNNQKYKTIFITGNHDNYDEIEAMPQINFFGGIARKVVYKGYTFDNIVYIDKPTVINIENKKMLIIPGADSHDIWDGIIDGYDKNWRKLAKAKQKSGEYYFRVKHLTWWPQEAVQIDSAKEILDKEKSFDMILTHECPSSQLRYAIRKYAPTDGEIFLEEVKQNTEFMVWLHGHMHQYINSSLNKNVIGIYNYEYSYDEIVKICHENQEHLEYLKENKWQN
jgi:DNA repair exonuclease SbcCD nuclease subunit